ncbi:endolytic transglycosylase MltG [Qipengyuania aquimaris]|uniref:Endolytic murein transglycosylase n=1 Tax=Qipengyuania aquimaris TaxID=255984 RepID=A0A9Q3XD41_9SPHN|nr:endolytic transglycosylase MltG [Qipengyuania aquimaris]MBY6218124.1 endolytic transglycosylase MltG [Qipengyuania aquimaris]
MKKAALVLGAAVALLIAGAGIWFANGWYGTSTVSKNAGFVVPQGASVTAIARKLETEGLIPSADDFLLRARIFAGDGTIKAGEYSIPEMSTPSDIMDILQSGDVVLNFVTIPEGLPSILVHERLMAVEGLVGEIEVPEEGSILPDTYDFQKGEERSAVISRMQAAMDAYLAEAWEKRTDKAVVRTPEEALILASIVEKETAQADERPMVAGALSNRVRIGMMLGADATTIYPITKGKPLGRRIRVSELRSTNPYNTRAVAGLPPGPITNPGRESIAAVLDPAETKALYYVADGTGGHVFAETLEEHNRNAAKWRALRRERGEM